MIRSETLATLGTIHRDKINKNTIQKTKTMNNTNKSSTDRTQIVIDCTGWLILQEFLDIK